MSVRVAFVVLAVGLTACGTRSELYPASRASAAGGSAGAVASTGAGGGDAARPECAVAADCPAVASPCLQATCEAGTCGTSALARGTRLDAPKPLVCHATVCDGAGNVISALDPSNVPSSVTGCLTSACDKDGFPTLVPVAAGTPCQMAGRAALCDGSGGCEQCLTAASCAAGQECIQHACVSPSCANHLRDGDESDVDCGGACPGCPLGGSCSTRRDCASATCDPTTRRCVADPCHDNVRDGDETAVDCGGGSCLPCIDGQRCKVDFDCRSDDCDPVQLVCLPVTCIDQKKDADETGVDCGGGTCPPCAPGQGCIRDADCTVGCDFATFLCSGNVCADHRRNGLESDVDCGGGVCAPCTVGKMCINNGDCAPGHLCNAAKVCQ
jgi:hypothetical protein